jgi:Protein of unknown function (DUF2877)
MSASHTRLRVDALSADDSFLARLRAGTFTARLHSVFRRVVNLECSTTRRLYTLATAPADNGPSTLVVDLRSFQALELEPGAAATCDGTTVSLCPSLEISLQRVEPWSPALPEWPGRVPVEWLRSLIDRAGVSGGVKQPNSGADLPFDEFMSRRLESGTVSLKTALLADDAAAAHEHGLSLVGLGPGLTPAGDDFLVGLATICNQPGSPLADFRPLLVRLVQETMDRTNEISHAALAHAVDGRVRESIATLVQAMARGDRAAMEERGARVLSIGATSGTDILTGMLAGLELAEARRT